MIHVERQQSCIEPGFSNKHKHACAAEWLCTSGKGDSRARMVGMSPEI